jgi:hypothetical protein
MDSTIPFVPPFMTMKEFGARIHALLPPEPPGHAGDCTIAPLSNRIVIGLPLNPFPCVVRMFTFAVFVPVMVPQRCTVVPGLTFPAVNEDAQLPLVLKNEYTNASAQSAPVAAPVATWAM